MRSHPHDIFGMATCLTCNVPLSHLRQLQRERFCGEPCRWKYATLSPHQVCAVCGHRLSFIAFGGRVCDSPACRAWIEAERRERERQAREALGRRAGELRDHEARRLGIQDPGAYTLTILPSFQARITNLPERRRRVFRDFVNGLISEACARPLAPSSGEARPPPAPTPPEDPPPEVQAVLARACALCRGSCCREGGNHAYLNVDTIRRYMGQHPDQRPRDVLAAYLGHVGPRTFEGSCLFHRADGCSLPRAMRSDTCNQHFCEALSGFQRGLDGNSGDPVRGFFATAEGGAIGAAAYCDLSESRIVHQAATTGRELKLADTAGTASGIPEPDHQGVVPQDLVEPPGQPGDWRAR